MPSTVVVPGINRIQIDDECARAVVALAGQAKSDIDNLSSVRVSGFVNRTDSVLTFTDSTRTFSIAPAGTGYQVFLNGALVVVDALKSVAWANAEGIWFFYLDPTGALRATQDTAVWFANFTAGGAGVAAIYWDATGSSSIRRIDERHGYEMPHSVHAYLHNYLGTQYESGGALSGFSIVGGAASTAAAAQFSVADAVVVDEDIRHVITGGSPQALALPAQIPVFYLTGAGVWKKKSADAFPVIYSGTAGFSGANGLLAWNQLSGGTWTLQEVTSGNYVLVHLFLTTDTVEPVIAVQGQAIHTTLTAVRSAANIEISTIIGLARLLSTEKRALGTVIYQTSTAYSNTPRAKVVQTDTGTNYEDWRLERSLPV